MAVLRRLLQAFGRIPPELSGRPLEAWLVVQDRAEQREAFRQAYGPAAGRVPPGERGAPRP
ncbi:MAG: hypothetical protein K2X91_01055 [Thermoleophilia bacterium]|nr:hypothetical protein [Thermoleophilia bacterium]